MFGEVCREFGGEFGDCIALQIYLDARCGGPIIKLIVG